MLIIPAIDLIGGACVRLLKGDYEKQITYGSDPVNQALRFQSAGFTRLHVVDLEGARDGEGKNRGAIQGVIEASRVPVQGSGGVGGKKRCIPSGTPAKRTPRKMRTPESSMPRIRP